MFKCSRILKISVFCLLCAWSSLSSLGQSTLNLPTGFVKFSADEVINKQPGLTSGISSFYGAPGGFISEDELIEKERQIKANNERVADSLNAIKKQILALSQKRSEFTLLRDVNKLDELIAAKKSQLAAARSDFQAALLKTSLQGVYVSVLKFPSGLIKENEFQGQIRSKVATVAITDINGIYVSSITEVQNQQLIKDWISTTKSGKYKEVAPVYFKDIQEGYYIVVSKAEVSPLLREDGDNKNTSTGNGVLYPIKVYNPENQTDYLNTLKNEYNLDTADLSGIKNKVEEYLKAVIKNNNTVQTDLAGIEQKQNAVLKIAEAELEEAMQKKKQRINTVEKALLEFGVTNKGDILLNIDALTSAMTARIKSHGSRLVYWKEQEVTTVGPQLVSGQGDYDVVIRDAAILYAQNQIEGAKVEEDFYEVREVDLGKLVGQITTRQIKAIRQPREVFLYASAKRIGYKLLVAVRYKVKEGEVPVNSISPPNLKKSECPSVIKDIDGNTYKTVQIGNQCWMAENLKTEHYNDGSLIPNIMEDEKWRNLESGAWCHKDNDASYDKNYGKLYNYYTVSDPRKLCPAGWHVPNVNEWAELTNYLGGEKFDGIKMKSTFGWKDNGNGTNNSGFNGLPGGIRYLGIFKGGFSSTGEQSSWWCDTETVDKLVWSRNLYFLSGTAGWSDIAKENGLSVRCLRD